MATKTVWWLYTKNLLPITLAISQSLVVPISSKKPAPWHSYLITKKQQRRWYSRCRRDPRLNKLFIVPTIYETIPTGLVRQWMAAVIFYLITKKQQRRRGGTKEWGAAALKSAAAADWMSWRDRYLDIEPQICINFWRGTMPNYTLQTSRKKKSKTVQAYF